MTKNMQTGEQLKLIEGEFHHEEAREILGNIFTAKINFHQIRNFSSQERFGKPDEIAIHRIPALRQEIARLEKILGLAAASQKKLSICAEIKISLADD